LKTFRDWDKIAPAYGTGGEKLRAKFEEKLRFTNYIVPFSTETKTPMIVEAKDGANYLTAFTETAEIEKAPKRDVFTKVLSLEAIAEIVFKHAMLNGAVFNPYGRAVYIRQAELRRISGLMPPPGEVALDVIVGSAAALSISAEADKAIVSALKETPGVVVNEAFMFIGKMTGWDSTEMEKAVNLALGEMPGVIADEGLLLVGKLSGGKNNEKMAMFIDFDGPEEILYPAIENALKPYIAGDYAYTLSRTGGISLKYLRKLSEPIYKRGAA
jgi:hypothetical protein